MRHRRYCANRPRSLRSLHAALEKRFLETQHPRDLTLIMTAGAGDSKGLGTGRFHHEGLLKRVIAANFGRMPKVAQAAQENKILGYNLPQGVISQLYRACASGQPGLFSKVGLYTYVDPRFGGGKVNDDDRGHRQVPQHPGRGVALLYRHQDRRRLHPRHERRSVGNISMEKEALTLDVLAQAMAAHNNGGIVIAQVERIVEQGSIKPKDVKVPGILVDCVVVADQPEMHRMNYGVMYDPGLAGEVRVTVDSLPTMPLDERKIIARRAIFRTAAERRRQSRRRRAGWHRAVANEEKVTPYIVLTTEAGAIGGVLASGIELRLIATNADSIIQQNQQFDFYDGGGST
ncbi:CoA-transferase [Methylocystis parvus]|uniref:CoA-transferase n=1 Tax=Methylocystis parvus TaxID=134 RepID=UPI003C7439D1